MTRVIRFWVLILPVMSLALGCKRSSTPSTSPATSTQPARQVVVYTALDRQFSEPILNAFTKKTGIDVLASYDTESTKTVGLTNRIREERSRPRCDVFWNNEILNTIQLKNEGLLAPCQPAEAQNYPERYRDPGLQWYGFAARARILLVNTKLLKEAEFPRSIGDMASSQYKGKVAIAKPLFGTTASHMACLYTSMGAEGLTAWLTGLKDNQVQVQSGNRGAAAAVGAGSAAFALTDTDDAMEEVAAGNPVRIIYPDQGDKEPGTLFLPNTLAVVKGGPHPAEAVELINYLLSPEVEERLANGPSAQIPLNTKSKPNPRIKSPGQVKAMQVHFDKAAAEFQHAREIVEKKFLTDK